MHGLISGILPKHLITNKDGYLDFVLYSNKFGFCSLEPLKSHEEQVYYKVCYKRPGMYAVWSASLLLQ